MVGLNAIKLVLRAGLKSVIVTGCVALIARRYQRV